MGNSSIFSSPSSETYSYSSITGLVLSSFRFCNDPKTLELVWGFRVLELKMKPQDNKGVIRGSARRSQREVLELALMDMLLIATWLYNHQNTPHEKAGVLVSSKTWSRTFTWRSQPFHTYLSSFLWDIVKLNLSLLLDSSVLSNLHSSSIFSRESGLLFCNIPKKIMSEKLKVISVMLKNREDDRYLGVAISGSLH